MRKPNTINRLLVTMLSTMALLAVAISPVAAQRYSFRSYVQGLGNLNVISIIQDPTGYLWVGTQNGLFRYDGTQLQEFGPAQGLPERMIQALHVAADGTLLVATANGIYFQLPAGQFVEITPPAGKGPFQPLLGSIFASVKKGETITVTRNGAFRLVQSSRVTWVAQPIALSGERIYGVVYTPDGALWYGCDKDLCRTAGGKTDRFAASLHLPEEKWASLLVTQEGKLWMRGASHIGELDLKTLKYESRELDNSGHVEMYPVLAMDAQGRILTIEGASLALWEKGAWRRVTERNGLGSYEIESLYVDREGSVWFGEVGHGLKRWVGQDHWEAYTKTDGLSSDLVWSTQRDRKGRLWVGSEFGLDYIPSGKQTPVQWRPSNGQAMSASTLALASDGSIWAGNLSGEVVRIDVNTLTSRAWKLPSITYISTDGRGRIFIATNSGLYSLNEKPGEQEKPELVQSSEFKKPQEQFYDLCLDGRGRLWAATEQGLVVLDDGGWRAINMGNSGARPDVIAVDPSGAVWASGSSQDLMRLHIEGYQVVDAKHVGRPPLLSQQVVALMVDRRGWLWVGQDQGLSMFDGYTWRSYTEDDGLIWNDTDSFALTEDTDGSIWIGTSGGLSHLLTPADAAQHTPQAPAFTKVMYGSELLSNGAAINWNSNALEISMALLSFKNMQEAGIRYRLIGPGQTGDWEETRDLLIHYRNLQPGSYRFEVAQVDQTGRSVSPVVAFAFRILPRWWQLTWLRVGFGLLVLVIVFWLWRKRIGLLLRQKKQLEEAVQMRTVALEKEKGELVRTKDQLRHFAEHDDLTGLWNHRIIVDRLRIEVDRSRREGLPLSIILVDLDFFKRINDTFGHPAGDEVLKEASSIFQHMVRSYDWVGRYGGEEFLLILPGSTFAHARQRAEELRQALESADVRDGEKRIPITASFGVACGYPRSHEELIRRADEALYDAKDKGRNCVVAIEIESQRRPHAVGESRQL
ncbi:MAG TPA: diguanylate cyclase [Terracidiphilus sp.]|nr:diguanylate cyclase [Terracidiphilus sp.]